MRWQEPSASRRPAVQGKLTSSEGGDFGKPIRFSGKPPSSRNDRSTLFLQQLARRSYRIGSMQAGLDPLRPSRLPQLGLVRS